MDRFTAGSREGLLLLHGAGNVFERELTCEQNILVKPSSLLFKEPTVKMNLHVEYPFSTWNVGRGWGNRHVWLRLSGPGRIGVQSNFEPSEDRGNLLQSFEPNATGDAVVKRSGRGATYLLVALASIQMAVAHSAGTTFAVSLRGRSNCTA